MWVCKVGERNPQESDDEWKNEFRRVERSHIMKRPTLLLLATLLSLMLSAMFAMEYMTRRMPAQMITTLVTVVIGITLFMRYRKAAAAPPVDT